MISRVMNSVKAVSHSWHRWFHIDTCRAAGAVTMEMFQRSKAEHKNKQMEGGLNANDKCSWVSF